MLELSFRTAAVVVSKASAEAVEAVDVELLVTIIFALLVKVLL